ILKDLRTAKRSAAYFRDHHVKAAIIAGWSSVHQLRLMRLCRRMRIPFFILGDSNILKDQPRSWLSKTLKRLCLRWIGKRCAGFMPIGTLGQKFFEFYGADPRKIFIVPLEPDYTRFDAVDKDKLAGFFQRRGLSREKRYVLYMGRMVSVKRPDLLIDAFVKLAPEELEWDLLMGGKGPLDQALRERVPRELHSRVHWLGFCETSEVTLAFQAADVFVLPSSREPWALVINEAAAAGLAIVASDMVGAAYDIVQDGVSGRVFQSGDLDSLCRALSDAMNGENCQRYKKAVRESLAAWRKKADVADGVRKALASVGLP
ncbi:MAG: glycosyltransferase, partial [Planctomycetota bacterium]